MFNSFPFTRTAVRWGLLSPPPSIYSANPATECHPKEEWWFWTRMAICVANEGKIIALYISPLIIVTLPTQPHSYTILKLLLAFSVHGEMQVNPFPIFRVAKSPLIGRTCISFHLELSWFTFVVPAQLFCILSIFKSILFCKKKYMSAIVSKWKKPAFCIASRR